MKYVSLMRSPRKHAGYGMNADQDGAVELWITVLDKVFASPARDLMFLGKIAACATARHYFNLYRHEGRTAYRHLMHAAYFANVAARAGSKAPMMNNIFYAYNALVDLFERLGGEDAEGIVREMKDAAPSFGALYTVCRDHTFALEERYEEMREKEARNPNAYACALDGCPVKAISKAALKRCAGPCPDEVKPSYCSKECQRKVILGCSLLTVGCLLFPSFLGCRIGKLIGRTAENGTALALPRL